MYDDNLPVASVNCRLEVTQSVQQIPTREGMRSVYGDAVVYGVLIVTENVVLDLHRRFVLRLANNREIGFTAHRTNLTQERLYYITGALSEPLEDQA